MLRIDKVQMIEGITVYGDDENPSLFYVLPNTPRFRKNGDDYAFKFVKYRTPIKRENGKLGGAFAFFDVEFTIPEEQLEAVKEVLRQKLNSSESGGGGDVEIGQLTFTDGKASINLESVSKEIVETVWNPGSPALYGNYITPFTVEFTPDGAALFQQALQGEGGAVQVAYDLYTWAKLPPIKVKGKFNAEKFYSFYQQIDLNWSSWSKDAYREKIIEKARDSDSYEINFEWGATTDPEIQKDIREWAHKTMEDAIARKMINAMEPVSEKGRKKPWGKKHVTRDFVNQKISSFTLEFNERLPFKWNPAPRGTLPNIEDFMKYYSEVDTDDPFFRQLHVPISVNADFTDMPIHSVEVHVDYNHGNVHTIEQPLLKSPDDVAWFKTYTDGENLNYKYWYQVNYRGMSQFFKSEEFETDDRNLVINVDDTGILVVDAKIGDLDFSEISQAIVTLRYDGGAAEGFEECFSLDRMSKEYKIRKVILEPRHNPYMYKVKYVMANGRKFESDWQKGDSKTLYINSPFSQKKEVAVRTIGELGTDVRNIFLNLVYEDPDNKYVQKESLILSREKPYVTWSFPVVDPSIGDVTYSGTVQYADGTVEEIEDTCAESDTIVVGPAIRNILNVEVHPDLIDFDEVKLVKVSLLYEDSKNGIMEKKDVILRQDCKKPSCWTVKLKDKNLTKYQWQATFYMKDGTARMGEPMTSEEPSVVPKLPGKKARRRECEFRDESEIEDESEYPEE